MRHFTQVSDVGNLDLLIQEALLYKADPFRDQQKGKFKRIGMLFLNPSMRTRLSSQIAAQQLGMESVVFNAGADGWKLEFADGAVMNGDTVEHIKDAAPIFGQYFDILCVRTFPTLTNKAQDDAEFILQQFIRYAQIPVVSLESATLHPLQSLTDIITIEEIWRAKAIINRKPRVVLTWAPHVKALPQCVANSFAEWVLAWGKADFVITHPEQYELNTRYTQGATITHDQQEALAGADFVYVKNWSAYNDYGQVHCTDPSWMLTAAALQQTNQARVMHCLPVRRNVELSDEVMDSASSAITQQAGNRVWAAQAVFSQILNTLT
jgi:N-succinyl-L-ornithine transcarbamylase